MPFDYKKSVKLSMEANQAWIDVTCQTQAQKDMVNQAIFQTQAQQEMVVLLDLIVRQLRKITNSDLFKNTNLDHFDPNVMSDILKKQTSCCCDSECHTAHEYFESEKYTDAEPAIELRQAIFSPGFLSTIDDKCNIDRYRAMLENMDFYEWISIPAWHASVVTRFNSMCLNWKVMSDHKTDGYTVKLIKIPVEIHEKRKQQDPRIKY